MTNVSKWLTKKGFSPIVAELHVTNKCNLECKTCWQHDKEPSYSNELSSGELASLTEQAIRLGIKECYIGGGGEPMCRKGLVLNLMRMTKKSSIKGCMTTNCTLFDEEDVKEIINLDWDHLQVSIDGPDKETQNLLRGKGVFEKNLKILKLFKKWKKRLKKEKPHISFHTVLSIMNYKKLRRVISLAKRLGITEVNLQSLVIQSQQCKDLSLNPRQEEELQIELKKALEIAKKNGVNTNFERFLKQEKDGNPRNSIIRCFEPWNRITILSDGNVKTCCNPHQSHESIRKKALEQVWYGREFNRLRKEFYKGRLMKECCTHPNKR